MNSISDFAKVLTKYFNVRQNPQKYCDTLHWIVKKEFRVDLIQLDILLHERHGEYEKERKISMAELIEEEYGREAYLWVKPKRKLKRRKGK